MKVYLEPPAQMSQAMFRVSRALTRYAPIHVDVVRRPEIADFHVMHVIGPDAVPYAAALGTPYAVIQYCLKTAGGYHDGWYDMCRKAAVVWSYYRLDLDDYYHAPLGVNGDIFRAVQIERNSVMTSGYVTGPTSEAIEEVAIAAAVCDIPVTHLGPVPVVEGSLTPMLTPGAWRSIEGVTDSVLAVEYSSCMWVSGLRHIEGFELPVIEGLACGARPLVFDQPDMRYWYGDHAVFIRECSGDELVNELVKVFANPARPVSIEEREHVLAKFDWKTIAEGFWNRVMETV
jgi:glycosyltransferase involved in cell wall biosynthesis